MKKDVPTEINSPLLDKISVYFLEMLTIFTVFFMQTTPYGLGRIIINILVNLHLIDYSQLLTNEKHSHHRSQHFILKLPKKYRKIIRGGDFGPFNYQFN